MNVNLDPTELTLLMKLTLTEYENAKRKYFANDDKRPPSEAAKINAAKLLHAKLHAHRWFAYQETGGSGEYRANQHSETHHVNASKYADEGPMDTDFSPF